MNHIPDILLHQANERYLLAHGTITHTSIHRAREVADQQRKEREELEWARTQRERPVSGFAGALFAAGVAGAREASK